MHLGDLDEKTETTSSFLCDLTAELIKEFFGYRTFRIRVQLEALEEF